MSHRSNSLAVVTPRPWLLLVLVTLTVECGGSPAITCQTSACSSGSKTYQVCSHIDNSVSYNYGGQSCACASSNSAMCQACATMVASYCSGALGGTGGSGGSGGSDGTGVCTATFSGGVTGTISPCQVSVTYTAAGNVWLLSAAGTMIPGTDYEWTGLTMTFNGMPMAGTFNQTASVGSSNQVTQPDSSDPPIWEAGFAQNQMFGSASLTITALGEAMNLTSAMLYTAPHGTVTATLADQNPMTAKPNVMMTLTF